MGTPICHIVAAGPCKCLDFCLGERDLLIAADGGYAHCICAGLKPQLFIGDLDSLSPYYTLATDCEQLILPCDKDDTDTLSACKEGLRRGFSEFRIHAALGGDVGHEVANIQALAYLSERGAHGVLFGGGQEIHFVAPHTPICSYEAKPDTRVSIFAFGGQAYGVTVRGLHWELTDAQMSPYQPIGVSNRVECGVFDISVTQGALLVVIG